MSLPRRLAVWLGFGLFVPVIAAPEAAIAVNTSDTRLLSSPAITEGKIAFVYADDVWVANADGTGARRLTSHPGEEQNPHFAPDGKHIAFTAQLRRQR